MKILAIETATAVCAAAIVTEDKVLRERSLFEHHIHSEKLLTMIDDVQKHAGDYDAIAVSIGPGSFTGLRIGVSVAKGLAFALDKPPVAVPTLEALAWRAVLEGFACDDDDIVAMIDARRNGVYAGAYRTRNKELTAMWGPDALSLEVLATRLPQHHRVVFMGDAVGKFVQHYEPLLKDENRFHIPEEAQRVCSAAAVGSIGIRMALRRDVADRSTLEPLYVKEFVTLVHQQHVTS